MSKDKEKALEVVDAASELAGLLAGAAVVVGQETVRYFRGLLARGNASRPAEKAPDRG